MDSPINPIHLVTPDRTIVPMPKPFDAPPGQVPFHRMLQAENLAESRVNRIAHQNPAISRPCDCYKPSNESPATSTAPKLGEILPVSTPTTQYTPSRSPALPVGPQTGRMIDMTI